MYSCFGHAGKKTQSFTSMATKKDDGESQAGIKKNEVINKLDNLTGETIQNLTKKCFAK